MNFMLLACHSRFYERHGRKMLWAIAVIVQLLVGAAGILGEGYSRLNFSHITAIEMGLNF